MKVQNWGRSMSRFAVTAVLASVAAAAMASGPKITVTFKGGALKFGKGLQPYRSQRTVMVAFRETAKLVGAKISGAPDGKHVTVQFGSAALQYEPGHHGYKIGGQRHNMRASSEMRSGHLFVPIRLFSDITAGRVHAELE